MICSNIVDGSVKDLEWHSSIRAEVCSITDLSGGHSLP